MNQTTINLVCDADFTPDFLRELANAIEEDSVGDTFETAHGCAELSDSDD